MWKCPKQCHTKDVGFMVKITEERGNVHKFYAACDGELASVVGRDEDYAGVVFGARCSQCNEKVYWEPAGQKAEEQPQMDVLKTDDDTEKYREVDIVWLCPCGNWGVQFGTCVKDFRSISNRTHPCGCGNSFEDMEWQVLNENAKVTTRKLMRYMQ